MCMFQIRTPHTHPPLCTERLFRKRPPENLLQTYLLHGSGRGTGTSRRSPDPRRSPHRWAGTGLCCPIWACRLPLPPPSSPAAHERGSGRPVPDSGVSVSTSFFSFPSAPPNVEMNSRRVWLSGEKAAVCFYFCECVQVEGCLNVFFCGLSPTRSFSPTAHPWKRDSVIYCDLWHFNRSYQLLMTVLFELCNVSYFKKAHRPFKTVNTLHKAVLSPPPPRTHPHNNIIFLKSSLYIYGEVMQRHVI